MLISIRARTDFHARVSSKTPIMPRAREHQQLCDADSPIVRRQARRNQIESECNPQSRVAQVKPRYLVILTDPSQSTGPHTGERRTDADRATVRLIAMS